ncbi:MAG: hypothetical protein ACRD3B_14685 [Candidatus Sulfotelmatobacter sp.]
MDERIGAANGAADDHLIQNVGGTLVIARPMTGRHDQCLGFARDLSSVPVGDGDIALASEASEARDAMNHASQDVGLATRVSLAGHNPGAYDKYKPIVFK